MLADLLAVKNGKITKDMLLGVQTISSVPDRSVPTADFQAEWTREGLDPKRVPDARQPVHVFQKACRSVTTTSPGAGRTVEVKVDQVTKDGTVYQITRMVRDHANRVIDHEKAMTLTFDKATSAIACQPRDPDSYLALRDLEDKVRDVFAQELTRTPGDHIRTAVRDTLLGLSATRVAERASVYFVPIAGFDTVESIQRVIAALYGEDAFIHITPWMNTDATRKIVERHHIADVKEDADAIMAAIHNRLNSGKDTKVRRDFVANKVNERIMLGRRVKEYRALLGSEIAVVQEAMGLLDEQLEKLMSATVE